MPKAKTKKTPKKAPKKPGKKQAKKANGTEKAPGLFEAGGDGPPDLSDLKRIFEEASREAESHPPLQWVDVECPHCGDSFDVCVDPGDNEQSITQNCQVCCKSVTLAVEVDEGEVTVTAFQD